ncbi:MAG: Gfo/Idh/MocA family oxidoreductase, partial [Deltaproteobacteria bacterium]|nr:Gfo/Idh/MocA family oxidoreductase [Deltaproteobacteria bacterium]
MKILLVGLGGFGRNHLRAWHEMGLGGDLYVADLDPARHADTKLFNLPADHVTTDYRSFLDEADIVDIVTPSTSHFQLCMAAFEAGKDVFVEKPMTMTSQEARDLAEAVNRTGRILQVGYYYRYHPISIDLHKSIRAGQLGDL